MRMPRSIPGFPGYEVRENGKVMSRRKSYEWRALRPEVLKGGYLRCALCKKGVKKRFLVHRLVAQAFIPNPENKPEVNHRNGRTDDNRASNLEWATASENMSHAFKDLGRRPPLLGRTGADHPVSKPVVQSTRDGHVIGCFVSVLAASLETGVNKGNISSCTTGVRKTAGGFVWAPAVEVVS